MQTEIHSLMLIYEYQHLLPNLHHCSHVSVFPLHEQRISDHNSKFLYY